MPREYSVFLDAVRFTSALMVLTAHLTFPMFTGGIVPYQGELAGLGVTTFFVLSGYVISYVADYKERTLRSFAVSRLARVYSVVLPAIFLTIAIDLVCLHLHWHHRVPIYQYEAFPKYLASGLTFMDQSWFLSEPVFGGHAFWSLNYEVWYYIIFAAATYYSSWRSWILVAFLLVISGPLVVIYLPLWLLGAVIYRLHQRISVGRPQAIALFTISLAAILLIRILGIDTAANSAADTFLHGWPQAHMHNSENFAGHYLVAMLVAINLFFAYYAKLSFFKHPTIAKPVVYAASFTFALYLMQRPLLDFYANLFHHNPHSIVSTIELVSATLFTVWLAGFVTEHRKHAWRRIFSRAIVWLCMMLSSRYPVAYRMVSPR